MKLQNVLPALKEFIASNLDSPPDFLHKIILFGSLARGEGKVGSDIDIALVSRDAWNPKDKGMAMSIFDNFDSSIEANFFCTTTQKIEEATNNFDTNYWIKREGVLLWEA